MKIENKVYSAKTPPLPQNYNLQVNKTGGIRIRHFTVGILFIASHAGSLKM